MRIDSGFAKKTQRVQAEGPRAARILVYDPTGNESHSLRAALADAAPEIEILASLKPGPALESKWDVLVTIPGGLPESDLHRLATLGRTGHVIAYLAELNRPAIGRLLREADLCHLVPQAIDTGPADLVTTVTKLLTKDYFGLNAYFGMDSRRTSVSLTSSTAKDRALDAIADFSEGAGLHARLATLFHTVADEFITNATYNAPVDAQGHYRFAYLSRSRTVTLDPGENISVEVRCDDRRIGIAVQDPFGSLRPNTVIDYLVKCFKSGTTQIENKDGGAGLGLYYAFEGLSELVINIESGKRTEFIGLMEARRSYREFASRPKGLNIFVVEQPAP